MGDLAKDGDDMIGVQVEETALKYGGAAWVLQNTPNNDGNYIINGEVQCWQPGATKGRDKYGVHWSTGDQEWLKLSQVRRLISGNLPAADTARSSSVRLLTAVFCCRQNHPLDRGGRY